MLNNRGTKSTTHFTNKSRIKINNAYNIKTELSITQQFGNQKYNFFKGNL